MANTNNNNNSSNNNAKQNPLALNFPSGAQPDISKCIKKEENEIKKLKSNYYYYYMQSVQTKKTFIILPYYKNKCQLSVNNFSVSSIIIVSNGNKKNKY